MTSCGNVTNVYFVVVLVAFFLIVLLNEQGEEGTKWESRWLWDRGEDFGTKGGVNVTFTRMVRAWTQVYFPTTILTLERRDLSFKKGKKKGAECDHVQFGREWGLHARRVEVFGPHDENIIHLTFLPSLTPINHNKCH